MGVAVADLGHLDRQTEPPKVLRLDRA